MSRTADTSSRGHEFADEIADVEFAAVRENPDRPVGDGDRRQNLEMLYNIPLTVTAELGSTQIPIRELLGLGAGAVIELDRLAGESIDLLVNGVLVGKGDVVIINENFGLRITTIISPEERLKSL